MSQLRWKGGRVFHGEYVSLTFSSSMSSLLTCASRSQFARPKDESLLCVRRDRMPQAVEGDIIMELSLFA